MTSKTFSVMVSALLIGYASPALSFNLGDLLDKEQIQSWEETLTGNPQHTEQKQTTPHSAHALSAFSHNQQINSLKQALTQGVDLTLKKLARNNAFWNNADIRIPLPGQLQQASALLRQFGMGEYADNLQHAMNRAAETAVPHAEALLLQAVQSMTIQDATRILTGPNDAATQYFQQQTRSELAQRFKPTVEQAMQQVELARYYDQFAHQGIQYGVISEQDRNLSDFITRKTLDGLFLEMAQQEQAIRDNPAQAGSELAQKVFSVIQ